MLLINQMNCFATVLVFLTVVCHVKPAILPVNSRGLSNVGVSEDFKQIFLATVNKIRAKYCAKPLIWDPKQAVMAQGWADKKAKGLVTVDYGDFDGAQNVLISGSLTPEYCAIAFHDQIVNYYKKAGESRDYRNFVNQSHTAIGVGVSYNSSGWHFCVQNFKSSPEDVLKRKNDSIKPTTCRLVQSTCKSNPDLREDCTWGDKNSDYWTKADCELVKCCWDDSIQGKPSCFYPAESGPGINNISDTSFPLNRSDTNNAMQCASPEFAAANNITYNSTEGPPFYPGTVATVSCKLGTETNELVLTTNATCQQDGSWTHLQQQCSHHGEFGMTDNATDINSNKTLSLLAIDYFNEFGASNQLD